MPSPDTSSAESAARSPEPRDLFTLPAAADRLSISRRTLHRLIAARQFPRPVKVGSSSRVLRQDIEGYLEQLRRDRGDKIGTS